jgi:hypothetical protein
MGRKRRISILVFDGVKLLDVARPSEVFSEANRFGANYEVTPHSADGRDVASSAPTAPSSGCRGAARLGARREDSSGRVRSGHAFAANRGQASVRGATAGG